MNRLAILFLVGLVLISSCENRDINEGEEFRPRAVRDNFDDTHFTKIEVDGVEYLMTERDNNNPHEGFGFMAFRANTVLEKQDSILSYLKTMQYFQALMYARTMNIPEDQALLEFDNKFQEFLYLENEELKKLQQEDLTNQSSPDASGE